MMITVSWLENAFGVEEVLRVLNGFAMMTSCFVYEVKSPGIGAQNYGQYNAVVRVCFFVKI